MRAADELLAKTGADGVQLLMTEDGHGAVLKVLDGSAPGGDDGRAGPARPRAGVDVSAAMAATREVVLGHGRPVGAVLPGADVTAA